MLMNVSGGTCLEKKVEESVHGNRDKNAAVWMVVNRV